MRRLSSEILACCVQKEKAQDRDKTSTKYYTKACFDYDEWTDSYCCPAGETLIALSKYQGNDKAPGYVVYGTGACAGCVQKDRCTRSKQGRRIKRYAGDEYKEALRYVMSQNRVKDIFSKRQAWVEPVFSELRDGQGLNRFRRKGLSRVKTEFGLHILAYNLGRAIAFSILLILCLIKKRGTVCPAIFLLGSTLSASTIILTVGLIFALTSTK